LFTPELYCTHINTQTRDHGGSYKFTLSLAESFENDGPYYIWIQSQTTVLAVLLVLGFFLSFLSAMLAVYRHTIHTGAVVLYALSFLPGQILLLHVT